MKVREQIKQKVMHFAYKLEMLLHHYRTLQEERGEKVDKSTKAGPGQIKTYYNNSKEERKLH